MIKLHIIRMDSVFKHFVPDHIVPKDVIKAIEQAPKQEPKEPKEQKELPKEPKAPKAIKTNPTKLEGIKSMINSLITDR